MTIENNHLSAVKDVAIAILDKAQNIKNILFYGEMGAGKTTLIKEICKCLGVKEATSSPTFSIVNEYEGKEFKVYHFDFYRIKNQQEALDIGCEEYFYSGDYCLIEWPQQIPDLLPLETLKVNIEVLENNTRKFSF